MGALRQDRGFTLVELMVVVLIIGILVAIAIPVFNAASASARERTCQANMRTIEGAVEQWLASNPVNQRASCDDSGWEVLLAPYFMTGAPTCPTADAHYVYDATLAEAGCTDATDPHPHF